MWIVALSTSLRLDFDVVKMLMRSIGLSWWWLWEKVEGRKWRKTSSQRKASLCVSVVIEDAMVYGSR